MQINSDQTAINITVVSLCHEHKGLLQDCYYYYYYYYYHHHHYHHYACFMLRCFCYWPLGCWHNTLINNNLSEFNYIELN